MDGPIAIMRSGQLFQRRISKLRWRYSRTCHARRQQNLILSSWLPSISRLSTQAYSSACVRSAYQAVSSG